MTILSASGLVKTDMIGSSDPYAVVLLNGNEIGRTRTQFNTRNPVWSEPKETFPVDMAGGEDQSNVVVQLWDEDLGMKVQRCAHIHCGFMLSSSPPFMLALPRARVAQSVRLVKCNKRGALRYGGHMKRYGSLLRSLTSSACRKCSVYNYPGALLNGTLVTIARSFVIYPAFRAQTVRKGMRGDFLGEASVTWEHLKDGGDLELTLVQQEGVQHGSGHGTIKLLVRSWVIEVRKIQEGTEIFR